MSSLATDDPLAGLDTSIDGLRQIGREFYAKQWSVGTSSNYSVVIQREPLQLLVTASGKDKGQLARDDFVRVGDDGRPLGERQPKSSAETLLHVVAARQPEVGAVLHTHSVWSTLLSDRYFGQGGLAIEGYEMLKGLRGIASHEVRHWVPIFENTQQIPDLAAQIAERFQASEQPLTHGYLIRRHGLYTWGRDLAEARRHVEIYEFLFEVLGRQLALPSSSTTE